MADVDNGDVLRIAATWEYDGTEEITNVFHCLVNSGGDKAFADVSDDIEEYVDLMYANIIDQIRTNQLVDRISVANVTQHLVFGSLSWGVITAGLAAGGPVPSGAACLAYGRTFTPRVQIKKYYGVFTQTALGDGKWVTDTRADVTADFNNHISPQAMTDGLNLTGVAWNRTLETYTLAVSSVTVEEPVYQRRRRRGRGS